jgi:signal peptidase I
VNRIQVRTRRFDEYPAVADLLLLQGGCRFRISSDSMAPTLQPGDLVELIPVRYDELATGDLLTVRAGDILLCHRLIENYAADDGTLWVVTKGDRSTDNDSPVPAEHIVGRVGCVTRPSTGSLMLWWLRSRARRVAAFLRHASKTRG